jgi:hypothetical protein
VSRKVVVLALVFVVWGIVPVRATRGLASAGAIQPDPAVVAGAEKLLDDSLTLLADKSSDKDTQYYDKGLWHFNDKNMETSWPVQGGPGTAAAVRSVMSTTIPAARRGRPSAPWPWRPVWP